MSEQLSIQRRQHHRRARRGPGLAAAFAAPAGATAAGTFPFPGIPDREGEDTRRTWVTGSLSLGLHLGIVGLLMLLASLAPMIEERLIPVTLIQEKAPPPPEEPAPAPKALAERRPMNYAPALQALQPQIVNPRVVAEASPAVRAEALEMDAVSSTVAPTQVTRSATVVERVSAVNSIVTARASAVDVTRGGISAVRGPVRIHSPVGPSVGPRRVTAVTTGSTMGTGTLAIGSGSSVREGVVSSRDVLGSPDGAPLVSVNIAVGEGHLRGSGGSGTGLQPAGSVSDVDCTALPAVQAYMSQIETRTIERWRAPAGTGDDQQVTLKFKVDPAGSATGVVLIYASDNAVGASAIDAMRSASPFPPIPEAARCLARRRIRATFNLDAG